MERDKVVKTKKTGLLYFGAVSLAHDGMFYIASAFILGKGLSFSSHSAFGRCNPHQSTNAIGGK
jgi:uncharacterized protein (UPF0332 family)